MIEVNKIYCLVMLFGIIVIFIAGYCMILGKIILLYYTILRVCYIYEKSIGNKIKENKFIIIFNFSFMLFFNYFSYIFLVSVIVVIILLSIRSTRIDVDIIQSMFLKKRYYTDMRNNDNYQYGKYTSEYHPQTHVVYKDKTSNDHIVGQSNYTRGPYYKGQKNEFVNIDFNKKKSYLLNEFDTTTLTNEKELGLYISDVVKNKEDATIGLFNHHPIIDNISYQDLQNSGHDVEKVPYVSSAATKDELIDAMMKLDLGPKIKD